MSYESMRAKYPIEFLARRSDKLNYRYPGVGGESYQVRTPPACASLPLPVAGLCIWPGGIYTSLALKLKQRQGARLTGVALKLSMCVSGSPTDAAFLWHAPLGPGSDHAVGGSHSDDGALS